MATATQLVSPEEYLAAETKPASEFEDGVVTQKPMPTWKHGRIQRWLGQLIDLRVLHLAAGSEITVRIREGKYLVPDVLAQCKDHIQEPYPVEPVALCVEILSPSDAMSEILMKCEAYHGWGVAVTWMIDPDEQRAWVYAKGERPKEATSALPADGFEIPVAEVFSILNS